MALLALLGIAGIYASQAEKAGWTGLAGYLLFSLFWVLTMASQFAQAVILPALATKRRGLWRVSLGIVIGSPSEVDLEVLPTLYALTGFAGYGLGGLLFGVGTLRAGILPRRAGALLAIAAVSVLAAPLLSHPIDRLLAVPMGLALVWLGFGLWSGRRENTLNEAAGGR